jgi:hypothetical protein
MFCERFLFQHDALFLRYLLELSVFLNRRFHHPDIKALFPGTQPICDPLFKFLHIVSEQVGWALFPPPQHARKIVPRAERQHCYRHFRMVYFELAQL